MCSLFLLLSIFVTVQAASQSAYNPSCQNILMCNYLIQLVIYKIKYPTSLSANFTASFPTAQASGYAINYGIQIVNLRISSSSQYDFHVDIESTLTNDSQVTFSWNSLYTNINEEVTLRIVLYSPVISSKIYIGSSKYVGPFSSIIMTNTIILPSAKNYTGYLAQSFLTGINAINSPICSIETIPNINSLNELTVIINASDLTSPIGSCSNIGITYIVLPSSIVLFSNTSIQFSLLSIETPSNATHTGATLKFFYYDYNRLFIDSLVHFGMIKLMFDIDYTAYGFGFPSQGNAHLGIFNAYISKFALILVQNVSSSGNCCGEHYFDWVSNTTCAACATINYTNSYPNSMCTFLCKQCCIYPVQTCYTCKQTNMTLVQGGCTDVKYCVKLNYSKTFSICLSCASPLIHTINSITSIISCLCPNYSYVSPAVPVTGVPPSCLPCLYKCIICVDNLSCDVCQTSHFFNITGGCTDVKYCSTVYANTTQTNCITCLPTMILDSVNSANDTCRCPYSYYFNLSVVQCQSCVFYCKQCQNSTSCQNCLVGKNVTGGCSKVKGCIEVISNPFFTKCKKCDVGFNLNSITNLCECFPGFWLVTGLCTDVIGCLVVRKQGKINRCLGCDMIQLFIYDGVGNCSCTKGYEYNYSLANCTQVCGDGRLFYKECDDGNINDGDGCSMDCKVERNYVCMGGNDSTASKCFVKIKKIKFQPQFIGRINKEHKGQFFFKISSVPIVLIPTQILTGLNILSSKNLKILQFQIKDNLLKIQIEYSETLEGNQALLQLSFDNNYISLASMDVRFDMISENIKLTFQKQTHFSAFLSLAVIILRALVTVLSFFNHKLSGPQHFHSSLFIFFIYAFSKGNIVQSIPLEYLSFFNLNIFYFSSYKLNILKPYSYEIGSIEKQVQLNALILFISLIIVIVRLLHIKKYILKKHQFDNQMAFVYHRVVFPICFSLIFLSLFSGFILYFKYYEQYHYLNIFSIGFLSIICFNQIFGCLISKDQFQGPQNWGGVRQCSSEYILLYMIYVWSIILSIGAYSLNLISNYLLIIFIFTFIMLLVFCYLMPYKNNTDNASNIFNLLIVLYFSGWYFLKSKIQIMKQYNIQLIIFNIFNFIIFVSIFLDFAIFIQSITSFCTRSTPQRIQKQIKNVKKQTKQINSQQNQHFKYCMNADTFNIVHQQRNARTKYIRGAQTFYQYLDKTTKKNFY